MSNTLNEARMPNLADKLDAKAEAPKKEKKVKAVKAKKVTKK